MDFMRNNRKKRKCVVSQYDAISIVFIAKKLIKL